jgi:hypothetical protein
VHAAFSSLATRLSSIIGQAGAPPILPRLMCLSNYFVITERWCNR